MEKQITVKKEYNSLDRILEVIIKESHYTCSKEYDSWDLRTDTNGQMKECLVIKKSSMHGMKVYFSSENTLMMNYIIPNKILNAYFGKSKKRYRNILEIIAGSLLQALLSVSQKKAFEEIKQEFSTIAA